MRAFILVFSIFLTFAAKAETISACDAQKYVGKLVTVEGIVSDVHHAESGKATFLNMCGIYPSNGFSGVIFSDDAPTFSGIDSLKGKTVDITGRIKTFRDSPEIIVSDQRNSKSNSARRDLFDYD